MLSNIEEIKNKLIPILQRNGATRAGLFGSCVRCDYKEESDIDILVEINEDISLFDFVGIKIEIEEELGRKVDLVEYDSIKPALKNSIMSEQVQII